MPDFKPLFQFSPSWWNSQFGFSYDREYFLNVDTRIRIKKRMEEEFFRKFAMIPPECLFLKTNYGIPFNSMTIVLGILGCPIEYSANKDPWVESPLLISDKEMEDFQVLDFDSSPFFKSLMKQFDLLAEKYGNKEIAGFGSREVSSVHSSLTLAYKLAGERVFSLMYDSPHLVHSFLRKLSQLNFELCKIFSKKREVKVKSLDISDCAASLLSPKLYEEFGVRYNAMISGKLKVACGIHSCGISTHILSELTKIPQLSWFEVGWGTDLEKMALVASVRKVEYVKVLLNPARILMADSKEIGNDMQEIMDVPWPCDVIVRTGAIEYGTPKENIIAIFESLAKHSRKSWAAFASSQF